MESTVTTLASTTYAGFGRRLVALIIDCIILGVVQSLVVIPLLVAVGFSMFAQTDPASLDATDMGTMVAAMIGAMFTGMIVWYAISVLYYTLMESSKSQGSLGKMAMGIKVTDLDGNRISVGKAFVRAIGKLISSFFMCIGYLMAAFTEKKQGLHDMMASTLVLKK